MKLVYITSGNFKSVPLTAHCHHILNQLVGFKHSIRSITIFVKTKSSSSVISEHQYYNRYITIFSIVCLQYIASRVKREKLLIHTRDRKVAALILSLIGFKVGIEFHSPLKLSPVFCWLMNLSISRDKLIIFATSHSLSTMLKQAYNINNIVVIPNGISSSFLDFKYQKLQNISKIKLCLVSTPRLGKGQEQLIDISTKYPDVECTLIGALHESFHSSHHQIKVHGYTQQSSIPALLNKYNVFFCFIDSLMHVSGGRIEDGNFASPLKIFEYLSTGRPIIISPRISLVETFGHLKCIFILKDNLENFPEICKKIKNLHMHDLDSMRSQNQKFLNDRTWKSRAQKIINTLSN